MVVVGGANRCWGRKRVLVGPNRGSGGWKGGVRNQKLVLVGENGCLWVKMSFETRGWGRKWVLVVQTGVLVIWQWLLVAGNVNINISRVK
jgi:hypothetical protein